MNTETIQDHSTILPRECLQGWSRICTIAKEIYKTPLVAFRLAHVDANQGNCCPTQILHIFRGIMACSDISNTYTNQQLCDWPIQILLPRDPSPMCTQMAETKNFNCCTRKLRILEIIFVPMLSGFVPMLIPQQTLKTWKTLCRNKKITYWKLSRGPSCCLPVCKIPNFQFWRRKEDWECKFLWSPLSLA